MKAEALVKRLGYAFFVSTLEQKDVVDNLAYLISKIGDYEALRDGYREDKKLKGD